MAMTGIERTLQLKNFLIYNFVFWIVLCLWDINKAIDFSLNFDLEFDKSNLIRWPISRYLSYWMLSYLIFEFYQTSIQFKRVVFLFFNLLGSILFAGIHKVLSGITGLLLERLFMENETKTWRELIDLWTKSQFDLLGSILVYWLVLIIIIGLNYYRRFNEQNTKRLELEGELGKAQLKSMKMQMNPHFLFNAFNTIAMMVRQQKNDKAIEMIGGLSDMFRLSLNKESKQFVPLSNEVNLIEKYLAIESLRYQDRLSVQWDIDENVLNYEVPNFILQPIVENAFKHGISKTLNQAQLSISIKKDEEYITIEVFNTGSGLSGAWELQKDKGIGLSNTIDRLLKLYEDGFKFLINEKDNGVSVMLKLPKRIR